MRAGGRRRIRRPGEVARQSGCAGLGDDRVDVGEGKGGAEGEFVVRDIKLFCIIIVTIKTMPAVMRLTLGCAKRI